MGIEEPEESAPIVVTQRALRQIEARLKTRFRAFLRPGERVRLSVEEESDFVCCQMIMGLPDDSFSIDLEAAIIVQDQEHQFLSATTSRKRLLAAIEFLSSQLDEYFRSQRQERFHIDWRIYSFESANIRFRGRRRHRDLEREASDLLGDDHEEPR